MNTIISYLDNMFAPLPKSQEILQLKEDLLANMEEKYFELKREGKSENEAVGVVISEFGNIDEIIEEFDLGLNVQEKEALPLLEDAEVFAYIEDKKSFNKMIGLGVFLCIVGFALLVLMIQMVSGGSGIFLGLATFLVCIAVAVGLFIYNGMKLQKYKHIDEGSFEVSAQVKRIVQKSRDAFQPTFVMMLILGIALCILSPLTLLWTASIGIDFVMYGISLLLLMVAIAVFIFIYFGGLYETYKKLLQDYVVSVEEQKSESFNGAVAGIVMPLAVIIFLITGLVFHLWYINWLIFPIAALICGMFSAFYDFTLKS
ncbi:permease prefix domain 1-containing protein [Alkalihalobacillus trypoxylicola]|uniref:Beta-carotene 15,15'-monooxygenase n=1 Tax=Alkalihalobacillus trypoxylicola TaxID=519424 RepID=A0A161Q9T6_9BACI|nr:permease prefix domain 1-containing protein [Alkalihalobacillus trypoxylicola]KYG34139.1 hypothetical protein AZF04_15030 [Alkalihalobacillus trypoxylicola]